MKKRKEHKYIGISNNIYRNPTPIDKTSKEQYLFSIDKKKRMVLNNGIMSKFEVGVYSAVLIFFLWLYIGDYFTYKKKIQYHKEYVEAEKQNQKDKEDGIKHDSGFWLSKFNFTHDYRLYDSDLRSAYWYGDEEKLKERAWIRTYGGDKVQLTCLFISIWLAMIFFLYLATRRCRDRIVFDRENSTVYYQYLYGLKRMKSSFDDTMLQSMSKTVHFGGSYYLAIRFLDNGQFAPIADNYPYTRTSFYVWYMDKNRPLPPGELFDDIRESDYLRRREEGFPAPLHMSAIITPEWQGATTKYNDTDVDRRSSLKLDPMIWKLAGDEPFIGEKPEII